MMKIYLEVSIMKRIFLFVLMLLLTQHLFCENLNIDEALFEGINIKDSSYDFKDGEADFKFNIAYSPFLPAGGIYSIIDTITGKEAIVQIGFAEVDKSPYTIYLPEYIYNFFSSSYDKEIDKLNLKIKFLAWNREGEESNSFNIYSLIVKPEDTKKEISKNGEDLYYIQLGAFSYYQNSYPVIYKLLPSLEVVPKFYMVKKVVETKDKSVEIYRVLAGPYSFDSAKEITKNINSGKKATVFMHSSESVLKEFDKE